MSTEVENKIKILESFYEKKVKPAVNYTSKGVSKDEAEAVFDVGISFLVEMFNILDIPLSKDNIKRNFCELNDECVDEICKKLNI